MGGYLRRKPTLGRLALTCLPDIRWATHVRPIGKMTIRLRRNRSFWLRDPLTHEWFMFGIFKRLIQPGDVVYDVGSNIGLYARFLVRCFGAGQVVGFEPMTENFELLSLNVRHDPIVAARVRVLKVALGDTDGQAALQIDDISSASAVLDSVTGGQASQSRRQYGLAPRTETVSVRRLDHLLAEEKLPPPRVMKIDIEGAGALALGGARQTLERYRPKLAVELHGQDEGRAVWDILAPLGYHCFGYVARDGVNTYAEVSRDEIRNTSDYWQPTHLIASCDAAELAEPIKPAARGDLPLLSEAAA